MINGILLEHPVRDIKFESLKQKIPSIEKMIEGFEFVIKMKNLENFDEIFMALKTFSLKEYNILVRAFLINNLFIEDQKYFGIFDIKNFLYNKKIIEKIILPSNVSR